MGGCLIEEFGDIGAGMIDIGWGVHPIIVWYDAFYRDGFIPADDVCLCPAFTVIELWWVWVPLIIP